MITLALLPLLFYLDRWNQAVGACAAKGMLRVILDQLLPAMEEASSSSEYDVQPDVWTYNLALKATEVQKLDESPCSFVSQNYLLKKHTFVYSLVLYCCALIIDVLQVRGDVVGAKALMSAMTASGIVKDVITYNTALGTAAASRSMLGTQWAFQLLEEMAPIGSTVVTERKRTKTAKGKMDLESSSDEYDEESLAIPDNRTLCAALSALGGSGQHW